MRVSPPIAALRTSKCLSANGWMTSWSKRGSLPDVDGIVVARQGKAHFRVFFVGPPRLAFIYRQWRTGKWTPQQHHTVAACLKVANS